jgi:hypothetical protein
MGEDDLQIHTRQTELSKVQADLLKKETLLAKMQSERDKLQDTVQELQ